MAISKKKRLEIFNMFGGKCAYCGIDLPAKWHVDHKDPICRKTEYIRGEWTKEGYTPGKYVQTGECYAPENERDDNYFPACAKCNIEKSSSDIEGFRQGLERKIKGLRENSAAFRHAERYGLVQVIKEKVVFYFELHKEA